MRICTRTMLTQQGQAAGRWLQFPKVYSAAEKVLTKSLGLPDREVGIGDV